MKSLTNKSEIYQNITTFPGLELIGYLYLFHRGEYTDPYHLWRGREVL